MTRHDLRLRFAQTYCDSPLGVTSALGGKAKRYARDVKTLVVDTVHLTAGVQHHAREWTLPHETGSPIEVAHRATTQSRSSLMRGLHVATAVDGNSSVRPAYAESADIEWTARHRGGQFDITAVGSVEHMLHMCDITENEHERIMIAARQLAHSGDIVYAAASYVGESPYPQPRRMHFEGLVACALTLLPGTRAAIEYLREQEIRLVYITSLPEDTATQIAHAAHITTHPKIARHSQFAHDTSHATYAHADRTNSQRIIQQLPRPVIVARNSLSELVAMIRAYR